MAGQRCSPAHRWYRHPSSTTTFSRESGTGDRAQPHSRVGFARFHPGQNRAKHRTRDGRQVKFFPRLCTGRTISADRRGPGSLPSCRVCCSKTGDPRNTAEENRGWGSRRYFFCSGTRKGGALCAEEVQAASVHVVGCVRGGTARKHKHALYRTPIRWLLNAIALFNPFDI
jgi:hypothetical protein